jgi:hypothetical protein
MGKATEERLTGDCLVLGSRRQRQDLPRFLSARSLLRFCSEQGSVTTNESETDKPECSECDKPIDGEVVWYSPFAGMKQQSAQVYQFVSTASNEPVTGSELPFHPACFEKRTGQKWPPESK